MVDLFMYVYPTEPLKYLVPGIGHKFPFVAMIKGVCYRVGIDHDQFPPHSILAGIYMSETRFYINSIITQCVTESWYICQYLRLVKVCVLDGCETETFGKTGIDTHVTFGI